MGEYTAHEGALDATGMRFAIVVARFNRDITERLLEGAEAMFAKHDAADVRVAWVPGAYELPLVAKRCAGAGTVDAVVCLGAVIRGETAHFEFVAGETAAGITLTVDNREQALDRLGGSAGHKGEEAALTAIEMVSLLRDLP